MDVGPGLVALLALDDRDGSLCVNRRRYAGTPAILRQVDMAAALGAQEIVLLAEGPGDPDVLATQHLAERIGLRFSLVARPSRLPQTVGNADEIVLLAPGAAAADGEALQRLLGGTAMLTVPAESREAAGLERLDRHSSWAGGLRMPGQLVDRLDALGDDCEPLSALPRIARSAGIPTLPIGTQSGDASGWATASVDTVDHAPRTGEPQTALCVGRFAHELASRNVTAAWLLVLAVLCGLIAAGS